MSISVPSDARSENVFPRPLAGSVEVHRFESRVLEGNPWNDPSVRDVPVYLPPSGRSEGLPLLVLLSGYTGSGWMHFNRPLFLRSTVVRRLDALVHAGRSPEAVLVAPDCLTTLGGSQYLNSSATGRYEDYVLQEVVPWVQDRYRTGPCAVLGTSSGGYGALVLALRHPDVFRAAGSNAGDAYFEYCYASEFPTAFRVLRRAGGPEAFLRRMLAEPTSDFRPGNPVLQAFEMLGYSACYSPVPDRPSEFDLPFDLETGALRDDVWSRWLARDPVRMARAPDYSAALHRLAYLYVDGGEPGRVRARPRSAHFRGDRPRARGTRRPRGVRRRARRRGPAVRRHDPPARAGAARLPGSRGGSARLVPCRGVRRSGPLAPS